VARVGSPPLRQAATTLPAMAGQCSGNGKKYRQLNRKNIKN